jgi:long-chain fatty acid transport protein
MTIQKIAAAFAFAALGASTVFAAGMERTQLPTSMMFKEGNYASLSFSSTAPDVTDNRYAPAKSMYADYSSVTGTFKTQLNEKLSVGIARYQSEGIDLSYVDSGSTFSGLGPITNFKNYPYATLCGPITAPAISGPDCTDAQQAQLTAFGNMNEPYVNLKVISTALMFGYKVKDDVTVIAGIKHSAGSATADVVQTPYGDSTHDKSTDTAMILGASFEKPEIALRATLVYQAKSRFSHTARTVLPTIGVTSVLTNTRSATPERLTLDFQTGIAKDTLLFGSIHHAKWSDAHIYFDGSATPRSTWTTTNSYSLGVGRKLSDTWAISASLNKEAASEATGSSLLSTTDGVTGITLGGKFTRDNMTITAGVNKSELGDKTVTSIAGPGTFSGNSATTFGFKVSFKL